MYQLIGDLQAQLEDLLRRDVKYDLTREEGAAVLDLCDDFAACYVAYDDVYRWANVLWAAHTYLMPCWYYTPRLLFISPESGCGKTRAMTVTEHLVPNAKRSDRMTAAAATYSIEKQRRINGSQPALLLDEMDTRFGEGRSDEDMRQIIDSGFERGGAVTKTVRVDGRYEASDFVVYGPMAIAGKMDINQVPSTIRTRSIVIQMQKRAAEEKVKRWNKRRSPKEAEPLRNALACWTELIAEEAANYEPEMPEGVEDRDADLWEPVVVIGDLAGGQWRDRARVAAVTGVAGLAKAPSERVLLLNDLKPVYAKHHWIDLYTAEILAGLVEVDERWAKLTGVKLRNELHTFGVAPEQFRRGGKNGENARGYRYAPFPNLWRRYPLPKPVTPITPQTPDQEQAK
ncbi:DUF3631 domain-containing protein [Mycobacterium gordonae]|uniref:DUF3631 domain-containing protein n=1 Tax=Mycobacterium gordonae TaxID=1778 RepID=A0A1X1W1T4_MYCGO|nr:DUF3631 domain-containing protein [Mycobacterium gordonae]MCV7007429.1 DUF3631 domain-containing protein [Mycobacterium gordonae]ODR18964.1 hypothetical protein BHQ23_21235 [Mycobacterium gordonae]ORV80217.1 hypothetical protein AWC08_30385 [Mycobacterium gordonae]